VNHVYLSQAGYDGFKLELKNLKEEKRPYLSKRIQEARAHGDLKENAEYDAAREDQGMTEARIRELEDKLSRAKIIDNEDISSDEVYIGASVTLLDIDMENEIVYSLVSEDEADFAAKKISISSPVGEALLGHKVGDVVKVQVPARLIQYKVLKIER